VKFGPLEKGTKISIEMNFSEEQPGTSFLTTKGMKEFWKGLE